MWDRDVPFDPPAMQHMMRELLQRVDHLNRAFSLLEQEIKEAHFVRRAMDQRERGMWDHYARVGQVTHKIEEAL